VLKGPLNKVKPANLIKSNIEHPTKINGVKQSYAVLKLLLINRTHGRLTRLRDHMLSAVPVQCCWVSIRILGCHVGFQSMNEPQMFLV